jgi:hypothetical protein
MSTFGVSYFSFLTFMPSPNSVSISRLSSLIWIHKQEMHTENVFSIACALQAAREALDLMGARKFYDIVLRDVVHHQQHKITDEIDVTTSKDYMQVLVRFLSEKLFQIS